MKRHIIPLLLILSALLLYAGEVINDSLLGYTITLPDNWVRDTGSVLHPRYYDTTRTYSGIIAIERYDFSNDTVYTAEDEWTRANFIAYAFIIDADPFSSMIFYDTVTSRQSSGPWSTESYSVFYDPETSSGDFAEYLRFTAAGTSGFEIYAISQMDDMNRNVGLYAAIVQSVTVHSTGIKAAITRRSIPSGDWLGSRYGAGTRFDLLGRSESIRSRRQVPRIVVTPGLRSCLFR